MNIGKITNLISSITSSNIAKQASKKVSALGQTISNKLDKSVGFDSFIKKIEPTNHDNAFIPLTTLMVGTVIIPRVITASKRNPDDKQATKDEITEILFRDVQTVAIILFLLKALNAVVGNGATKLKGLPMVNKAYESMFDKVDGNIFHKIKEHVVDFAKHPIKKTGILGKNILATVNPMEGTRALTNSEFVSKYAAGYGTSEEISKFFDSIQESGGDKDKVFNRVMDSLISMQVEANKKDALLGKANVDDSVLKALESIKEKGIASLSEFETSSKVADKKAFGAIKAFFADKDNALVKDSIKLNAWMNAVSLGIESLYLGFGLPALNQKRLEKKYLSKESQQVLAENKSADISQSVLNKTVKPQEIKLYQNFIKG